MKHYEKGGIDRPSRSPLLVPIALSEQERLDLVAFMEALTGAPEGEFEAKAAGHELTGAYSARRDRGGTEFRARCEDARPTG